MARSRRGDKDQSKGGKALSKIGKAVTKGSKVEKKRKAVSKSGKVIKKSKAVFSMDALKIPSSCDYRLLRKGNYIEKIDGPAPSCFAEFLEYLAAYASSWHLVPLETTKRLESFFEMFGYPRKKADS